MSRVPTSTSTTKGVPPSGPPSHPRYLPGPLRKLCHATAVSLTVCLVVSATASALAQRGHVLSFTFGAKGSGEGQFAAPSGIAVAEASGNVYVADRKGKRVEWFTPEYSGAGSLIGENYGGSLTVTAPQAIAIDNSEAATDPSRGDVYVVAGTSRDKIFKFSASGAQLGEIKSFMVEGVKTRLGAIEGIAVDTAGRLLVYQEEGGLDTFSNAEPNVYATHMQTAVQHTGPGLAVDAEGNLYVGAESESEAAKQRAKEEGRPETAIVAKLDGTNGSIVLPELDQEYTTGVAANASSSEPQGVNERDDVYITNASHWGSSESGTVAQFGPAGTLLQRFTAPGMREPRSVAVNGTSGTVYVLDAGSDQVEVFGLEPPGPPKVTLTMQTLEPTPPATSLTRLTAQIDPTGADTHYRFEYGTTACASSETACTSTVSQDVGENFGNVEETLELPDLAPGTYHARVVAENSYGTTYSSERTFSVLNLLPALLDGRAWEMVSPPSKAGASIEPLTREGGVVLASEEGSALTYVTEGAIAESASGNRTPEQQQAIATRSASGWSSQDIATPQVGAQGVAAGAPPEYQFFSADLSLSLVQPWATSSLSEPPLSPEAVQATMYLRHEKGGTFQPLITEANVPPSTTFGGRLRFQGATPDLSHVVLRSGVPLAAAPAGPGLYEWSSAGLEFVSALPGGGAAPEATLGYSHIAANAISRDGSRVIWTNSAEGRGHLYLHDAVAKQTVQLDAAQGVTEPPDGSAQYQFASSDGSKVFFTDEQKLVPGSTAEPEQGAGKPDLYECELIGTPGKPECLLRDLTVDANAGEHASVQGAVFGAGQDGTTLYFVARGVLANNENGAGATAEPGRFNLYELHSDGAQWATVFIGSLSPSDKPEWELGEHANTAFQTTRASANGNYLAFMSAAPLTGYDNRDLVSGVPDEEVYLYDAAHATLSCVSCKASGQRPAGVLDTVNSGEGAGLLVDRREIWLGHWLAGNIPGWTSQSLTSALYQSRYLSDAGRLFFNSPDELVPAAENHKENVYEYEPAGLGDCQSDSGGGCVGLISSGDSRTESAFLEATPSGSDVFFLSAARLLPQDSDTAFDIYDARVCTTESPCLRPVPPSSNGCETADMCRPLPPSPPAPFASSGSATFSGPLDQISVLAAKVVHRVVPPTRAQRLAKALASCRSRHRHHPKQRRLCEAHARKLYGPVRHTKKPSHRRGKGSKP